MAIKITPRLEDNSRTFFESNFQSRNAGAEKTLTIYPYLWNYTLAEMRGIFTEAEIKYLVDIGNGFALSGTVMDLRYEVWIAQIEDADRFDGIGAKWEVSVADLCAKVKSLTAAQVYFMQENIQSFWYGNTEGNPDLEKFIEKFV